MNADDLERNGRVLSGCGEWELFHQLGNAVWSDFKRQIEQGRHPRRSWILAFARGWSVTGAEWLPELAQYLADRLDPDVSTPDRGGRPRKSEEKRHHEHYREIALSMAVERLVQEGRSEDEAIQDVAERTLLDTVDVKLAAYKHPGAKQVVGTNEAVVDLYLRHLNDDE